MSFEAPRGGRQRSAAACPWCGAGTALAPTGDGFGNVQLCCTACGCKGPPMPIEGEFAEADNAAITRWSTRTGMGPRIDPDTMDRIGLACAVQRLLHGETAAMASVSVPIRMDDLMQILAAASLPAI